jgi:hypothetical protein
MIIWGGRGRQRERKKREGQREEGREKERVLQIREQTVQHNEANTAPESENRLEF